MSSPLFPDAMAIIKAKCVNCHQSGGTGVDFTAYLDNESAWVLANLVVPQHPEQSMLYQYLQGSGFSPPPLATMPIGDTLTKDELTTLHDWIAEISPDAISNPLLSGTGPSQSSVRLKERAFVKSVLDDIFGGPDGIAAQVTQTLVAALVTKFGGPCDPMLEPPPSGEAPGPVCSGVDTQVFTGPVTPLSSTPREGQRMKACNVLCFNDTTLGNAIEAATQKTDLSYLGSNPIPSNEEITAAYNLFFPALVPPASIVSSLGAVAQAAEDASAPFDPWRAVLLTLCYAPDWQVP